MFHLKSLSLFGVICLVCFVACVGQYQNTPVSALHGEGSEEILGTWQGTVIQLGHSTYPVKMTLETFSAESVSGKIDYPTLNCGGVLKSIERNGSKYILREKIKYGDANCTDNGKIIISRTTGDRLNWKWFDSYGDLSCFANLEKKDVNKQNVLEKENELEEIDSKIIVKIENGIKNKAGTKWAVVIGISKYKDTRIPSLRYASKDAQFFYNWLISPNGGQYAPARVKLLIDIQATGNGIRASLFEWLGQALEEDIVTIFFAGHGSPQSPDKQNNLFLLPYDTQYDSVATTGFPMWDIETALKRFIIAKRVIVITDACHAGGLVNLLTSLEGQVEVSM